jgi:hypothetical protein
MENMSAIKEHFHDIIERGMKGILNNNSKSINTNQNKENMETLQLEKSKALKLFKDVPKWFQEILIETFGKECFSGKIIDRIKTFEDACHELGIDPDNVEHSYDSEDEFAYKKLKLIAKVLNEGWEPNWNDRNERKWWPWFKWSSGSGFGFSHSNCAYVITLTSVGSRLCLKTEELANYFGRQFIEIHRDLFTIKK